MIVPTPIITNTYGASITSMHEGIQSSPFDSSSPLTPQRNEYTNNDRRRYRRRRNNRPLSASSATTISSNPSPTSPNFSATPIDVSSADPATTVICVVGVGFVGESLVREFSTAYHTIGFDISAKRIAHLRDTVFTEDDEGNETHRNVELTTDETALRRATHYLVSVPTLLRADRSVNLDYVHSALATVLKYARPGCCIVIESSVSVGITRTLLGPYKHIFNCGMSPERVDPGRVMPAAHQIPKVVSGLTPVALKAVMNAYGRVFQQVVPVSRPEVAEMTKLFENCYRMVNIAYVNEMADACRAHGIDPREMVDAAATKPYGFEAFSPGLGVGGHCIPVNPFYLFANNKNLPVLERATTLMWNRPKKLARKFHRRCLSDGANTKDRAKVLPRILIVGVGFKPGQAVLSCSPGISFAQTLNETGCARLAFYDPLVPQHDVPWMEKLEAGKWNPEYLDDEFDGIAICTPQHGVDFDVMQHLNRAFVRHFSD